MSLQVEALLEQILDELKGLREDMKVQSGAVVQSDADWYREANSLGEVL